MPTRHILIGFDFGFNVVLRELAELRIQRFPLQLLCKYNIIELIEIIHYLSFVEQRRNN